MSELEKVRAVSLLSIIVIALVAMFALQSGQTTLTTHRNALQVCAATKGALCEIADNPATVAPISAAAANLGAMVVAAPPVLGVEQAQQSGGAANSATDLTADLGAMTVFALSLPSDRFTEVAASHEALEHLTVVTDAGKLRIAASAQSNLF